MLMVLYFLYYLLLMFLFSYHLEYTFFVGYYYFYVSNMGNSEIYDTMNAGMNQKISEIKMIL